MPLWNRVKQELDRAGKAAQDALDEGKVRLDAFRARQLADKAAQALGYAVYRARTTGAELDGESYERLRQTLATHDAEASRLEATLAEAGKEGKERPADAAPTPGAEPSAPPPPDATSAPGGPPPP